MVKSGYNIMIFFISLASAQNVNLDSSVSAECRSRVEAGFKTITSACGDSVQSTHFFEDLSNADSKYFTQACSDQCKTEIKTVFSDALGPCGKQKLFSNSNNTIQYLAFQLNAVNAITCTKDSTGFCPPQVINSLGNYGFDIKTPGSLQPAIEKLTANKKLACSPCSRQIASGLKQYSKTFPIGLPMDLALDKITSSCGSSSVVRLPK